MSPTVPGSIPDGRADKILALMAGISRSEAKSIIQSGRLTINGISADSQSQKIIAGDEIVWTVPEVPAADPPDVNVVASGHGWLVVNKPAGLVVHHGAGTSSGTLADGLIARFPEIADAGDPGRWGLVHRIDKDVSGLLLVARDEVTRETLAAQMSQRQVKRVYRALVHGLFDAETGTIDAPLGPDQARPGRRSVRTGGAPARTHYEVAESFVQADLTELDVELETGRTHQIRVHLSAIGHPLVGDRGYGGRDDFGLGRIWLHAAEIQFIDPETGETVSVESELPEELERVLKRIRG